MQLNEDKSNIDFKSIGISLGLHVLIVLSFSLKAFFFPTENIELDGAIRVDVVGLPDKILENKVLAPKKPSPAKSKSKPKPKPKKDKAVNLNKKNKTKDILDKFKRRSRLDALRDEVAQEEVPETKGAQVTSGNQLKGPVRAMFDDYLGRLDGHVKNQWTVPAWIAGKNYRARASVKIDEQGFLISVQIVLSSGNPTYDKLVLDTVRRASPFPKPTDRFSGILENEGFLLGFPD
ncbi:MAG: energy transducer TonB [Bdellovibrionales bacterium]